MSPRKRRTYFFDEHETPGLIRNGSQGWVPYVSQTDFHVSGEICQKTHCQAVEGHGWRDRQWMTKSLLVSERVAWSWFAVKLTDGREVMMYRMWDPDRGNVIKEFANVIGSDGRVVANISPAGFELQAKTFATKDEKRYATAWDISLESSGGRLEFDLRFVNNDSWFKSTNEFLEQEFLEGPCFSTSPLVKSAWCEQIDTRWITPVATGDINR